MRGWIMNKKKLAMGLALALLMLPATAFATTVEAVADKTSVQAGDTVEVVITVQGKRCFDRMADCEIAT